MSFKFDGSTMALGLASAVVTVLPLTLLARVKPASLAAVGVAVELGNSANSNHWSLQFTTTGTAQAEALSGGTASSSASTNVIGLGRWSSAAGLFITATSRYAFLDSVLAAQDVTSKGPTVNVTDIGCSRNTSGVRINFENGWLADVAIYSAELSIGELLAFTAGTPPSEIRPSSLALYLPLFREMFENSRRYALVLTGAPTVSADHPVIYPYPRRRLRIKGAAAAASRPVKMAGRWNGFAGRSGGFAG